MPMLLDRNSQHEIADRERRLQNLFCAESISDSLRADKGGLLYGKTPLYRISAEK